MVIGEIEVRKDARLFLLKLSRTPVSSNLLKCLGLIMLHVLFLALIMASHAR